MNQNFYVRHLAKFKHSVSEQATALNIVLVWFEIPSHRYFEAVAMRSSLGLPLVLLVASVTAMNISKLV